MAELHRAGKDEFHVEMRIATRDDMTGKPLTHEQVKTVLLHEFGHAIGLWGHSKDQADVMYYAADSLHPTDRDSSTIKLVYSHKPGYSLHVQSIRAIREEMRSEPENAKLHFLLGSVYMDQGKYGQAIGSFRRCLALDARFYKASAALASVYQASGQDQAAFMEYLSLAESDPSALVHNVIGALYFEKKDTANAIQHFKKALELERAYEPAKRNLYKVYLNRGRELIDAGMHYAAIELLSEGTSFFPDKPELHDALGTAYCRNGQFQESIDQYIQALRINPAFMPAKNNMASCYNNQGVKYAQAGQWKESLEAYTEALKLMPDMEEAKKNISGAYWNRAVGLSKSGKDREAIEAYQQFLAYKPDSKEAHNNLGAVYFRVEDYEAAIAEFEKALLIDPGDKSLRVNLAIAYYKLGETLMERKAYYEAAEDFKAGLEIAPDNVNLHLGMAQAYQHLTRLDDAIRHVSKALTLEPGNAIAMRIMANLNIRKGYRALQAGDYDQALQYYSKVPDELMPPVLHNNVGYVYIMKGMYPEAASEFDKVLRAEPENETAYQNLLKLESNLSRAISRDPGSQKTKDELAMVRLSLAMSYMRRGDTGKSRDILKTALDLKPRDKDLRYSLAEGCMTLAEAFQRKKAYKDAKEFMDWANQLRFSQ
jgi:tetratricopeptide (TPR) repeat protein